MQELAGLQGRFRQKGYVSRNRIRCWEQGMRPLKETSPVFWEENMRRKFLGVAFAALAASAMAFTGVASA
jgi:hypothetical protein